MVVGAGPVRADTLTDAMASAYLSNPVLQGERARQRATDEQVPQALSGWRPTVVLRGEGGYEWGRSTIERPLGPPPRDDVTITDSNSADNTPARFAIGLSQPIFQGFRTVRETARAEANVAAGQQDLLAVEQEVLLDATAAYMDVVRDREIVALRQRNVEALSEQLRGATARFDVGEITRTDVEQARARQSLAQAELSVARANLAAAVAFYVQVVGHAPGTLGYPRITDLVPSSLEEALALANELNPLILAAAFNAEAARHQIGFVQADLLPSISLEAEFRASHNPSPGVLSSEAGAVLGVLRGAALPGGPGVVTGARGQADREPAAHPDHRGRPGGARVGGQDLEHFRLVGRHDPIPRGPSGGQRMALEGVNQEALVGTRTTLDVLDAEQELVQSQVNLVNARRNRVVAAYQLIATTGRLTAPNLGLAVPYYDPDGHYLRTRGRFFGVTTDTVD
jgi:outer membrane protein